MKYLTEVKKVPRGENGVSRTYGHHKNYFLCEDQTNLKLLEEFRKSHISEK
jgi:hypothetical protein